jgi:hypothetical protein
MQLPRGTFREIKKSISVSALLGELEKTEFSGVCSISYESLAATIVFKMGSCILADFKEQSGNAAWIELQKIGDSDVDAAISTLDEAQIQLSLEFNKKSGVQKAGMTGSKTSSRISAHTQQKKPVPAHPPAPSPLSLKTHRTETTVSRKPPAGYQPAIPANPPETDKKKTDAADEEPNSFDQDIETFDSMNLDNMTDKIRIDCKAMIKQLELEHLIDK